MPSSKPWINGMFFNYKFHNDRKAINRAVIRDYHHRNFPMGLQGQRPQVKHGIYTYNTYDRDIAALTPVDYEKSGPSVWLYTH